MRWRVGSTRPDQHGHQVVDIVVDRGYRPDRIQAWAGVPLRLVFHRLDDDACFERVVFSAPRLDRYLSESEVTVVDLPGLAPGEVRFTCGMGRYRGRIEISDANARSVLAAIRRTVGRVEPPVSRALVLWIFGLPLIALVAVLALDAATALVIAVAALVAWVVGCLWAFDRAAATPD